MDEKEDDGDNVEMRNESAVNVIGRSHETKQTKNICFTLSFMTLMDSEGEQAIQIFKQQKLATAAANSEQSFIMEISMVTDTRVSMNDIIVLRDSLLNLEKRT